MYPPEEAKFRNNVRQRWYNSSHAVVRRVHAMEIGARPKNGIVYEAIKSNEMLMEFFGLSTWCAISLSSGRARLNYRRVSFVFMRDVFRSFSIDCPLRSRLFLRPRLSFHSRRPSPFWCLYYTIKSLYVVSCSEE